MNLQEKYLNEKKESIESVAQAVNSEGLGYAIQHYLSWQSIEDKQLAKLWKQANEAMDKIDDILGEYYE